MSLNFFYRRVRAYHTPQAVHTMGSIAKFTRLTNAFSKKVDNLGHAVALHFMYYNFCRIHKSLRVTPAMEAGITDKLWSVEDIVNLLK